MYRCNVPTALAAEWPVAAELFESENFHGIVPLLFADSPAEAEVAFNSDPASARKDVDGMERALFQPEIVSATDALKFCKKPRPGDAIYAYKLANLEGLENPKRVREQPSASGGGTASNAEQLASSSNPPPSKRIRTEILTSGRRL